LEEVSRQRLAPQLAKPALGLFYLFWRQIHTYNMLDASVRPLVKVATAPAGQVQHPPRTASIRFDKLALDIVVKLFQLDCWALQVGKCMRVYPPVRPRKGALAGWTRRPHFEVLELKSVHCGLADLCALTHGVLPRANGSLCMGIIVPFRPLHRVQVHGRRRKAAQRKKAHTVRV